MQSFAPAQVTCVISNYISTWSLLNHWALGVPLIHQKIRCLPDFAHLFLLSEKPTTNTLNELISIHASAQNFLSLLPFCLAALSLMPMWTLSHFLCSIFHSGHITLHIFIKKWYTHIQTHTCTHARTCTHLPETQSWIYYLLSKGKLPP